MVFSSLAFLCAFLPIAVLLERAVRGVAAKNAVLIAASLVFYAYGEPVLVLLMLASTLANYAFGLLVGPGRAHRKAWVTVAVVANLGTLAVFKYAGMLVETVSTLLGSCLEAPQIPLPLGISFYTFQALSYVIDVYRGDVEPQRSYPRVLLYVSFFPQLVAGPIVKYHDFAPQMEERHATLADLAVGLRRFSCGLAKKVLLANVLAGAADALYALPASALSAPAAWVAALAYLLEIYLDFSAYSDMAIGLARAFGFTLQENFSHPYSSLTVREFWRRWHISLSTWFLEYLYIPLGGNRRGRARAVLNRAIVFFCCGLWHGASWTFVVWGLLHGFALMLEEVVDMRRLPRVLGHLWVLTFVTLAFVVFRCDTLEMAGGHLCAMLFGWDLSRAQLIAFASQLTPHLIVAALAGVLVSGSLPERVRRATRASHVTLLEGASFVAALVLMALSVVALSSGTYNPFIYFRF